MKSLYFSSDLEGVGGLACKIAAGLPLAKGASDRVGLNDCILIRAHRLLHGWGVVVTCRRLRLLSFEPVQAICTVIQTHDTSMSCNSDFTEYILGLAFDNGVKNLSKSYQVK